MGNDVKATYTIGGLSKRAGVNRQTVRYYERRKLIAPSGRKRSGYRLYDEKALKRLLFIRRAKELGFTLEEIRGLLDLRVESSRSNESCDAVRARTDSRLKVVEERIAALESVRRVLIELLGACDRRTPTEECPILRAIEDKTT